MHALPYAVRVYPWPSIAKASQMLSEHIVSAQTVHSLRIAA